MPPMRIAPTLAAALLAVAGCRSAGPPPPPPPSPAPPPDARVVSSNVERRDYAGSAACALCHSEIHDRWKASPMRRMTRLASADADVHAPFDGATFRFKGDQVTVEQHEGRRYMRVQSKEGGEQIFRVTRVIGGATARTTPACGWPARRRTAPPSGTRGTSPCCPSRT